MIKKKDENLNRLKLIYKIITIVLAIWLIGITMDTFIVMPSPMVSGEITDINETDEIPIRYALNVKYNYNNNEMHTQFITGLLLSKKIGSTMELSIIPGDYTYVFPVENLYHKCFESILIMIIAVIIRAEISKYDKQHSTQ